MRWRVGSKREGEVGRTDEMRRREWKRREMRALKRLVR